MKAGSVTSRIWGSSAILLAIFGFLFLSVAFYPGFMSHDSLVQYAASKSLIFDDWHPPVMAWLWSMLNIFFKGPEGLLFFHLALLWSGLFLWFNEYREYKNSWFILTIGFFPWVVNFSGVLWKDVGMAFAFLFFTGMGFLKRTPTRAVLAFIVLFYAINVRHNALFAAVPLVAWVLGRWFVGVTKVKIMAMTLVVLGCVVVIGNVFNYDVLQTIKKRPANYMMLDDLSYLSLLSKQSLIPGFSYEDIKSCESALFGETNLVGRDFCLLRTLSYQKNNPYQRDLKKVWLKQVIRFPFEYIKFRFAAFSYLLRTPSLHPFYIWHTGIDENEMELKQEKNGATIMVKWMVDKTSGTFPFLFKPYWWLWFSALLLLLTFSVSKSSRVLTKQVLLISSIFYILGYVPSTPTADFRYVYWSVIATSLATILMFLDWRYYVVKRKLTKLNVSLAIGALLLTICLLR